MTPVVHNYSGVAGKTVLWDTSDNEQTYLKNIQDPKKQQQLAELGFIDNPIKYQFNRDGFRTAEFDRLFDVVCFGCSFTMGTGVSVDATWPSQLAGLTGLSIANLGHAGSSNDTAFRLAWHYLKQLQPQYAIWQQTDRHRLELLDDDRSISLNILAGDTKNPCADDYFIKTWFVSDSNQQLNLEKNTRAFEQLCNSLDIKCVIIPRELVKTDQCARDLVHPGAEGYASLAKQIVPLLGL